MKRIFFYLFIYLSFTQTSFAYQLSEEVIPNLQKHIQFLAHDSLEGRATGSAGAAYARAYIQNELKSIGVEGFIDQGFNHEFNYSKGKEVGTNNSVLFNKKEFIYPHDFFPIVYSSNIKIKNEVKDVGYGILGTEIKYNDYKNTKGLKGKIFLINISMPGGYDPHSDFYPYLPLRTKTQTAIDQGAAGIIFYNDDENLDSPTSNYKRIGKEYKIPIIFVQPELAKLIKSEKKPVIQIEVDLKRLTGTGVNVAGFINNSKDNTIIFGAHYDHLGFGADGSLHAGEPEIHNGADDNASGVAAIIEIARFLKSSKFNQNNYLFILFSGEELGLFGSKEIASSNYIESISPNYMINMDMIGRLDSTTHKLAISGTGTSPNWSYLDSIQHDNLKTQLKESGIGPSDHTSFYKEGIPVLHYFTGAHQDYHKPGDDEHKINYGGIVKVMNHILDVVTHFDPQPKLAFSTTVEEATASPRFTVTLGVMPDYMYDDGGMRIDMVRENRPAEAAGMKNGDIVIKMGNFDVSDMTSYMQALSHFRSGDKTTVIILREKEEMAFDVEF